MHGVKHMLPTKIPYPRLHRPIVQGKLQLFEVNAVGLRLVLVHGLLHEPLHQRGLPRLRLAHEDELDLP